MFRRRCGRDCEQSVFYADRFTQFYDAAGSWSRVERIIARVEAGPEGTDTRFIVASLEGGRAK